MDAAGAASWISNNVYEDWTFAYAVKQANTIIEYETVGCMKNKLTVHSLLPKTLLNFKALPFKKKPITQVLVTM